MPDIVVLEDEKQTEINKGIDQLTSPVPGKQRKVNALGKTVRRKIYLVAQINPKGGDGHWRTFYTILKDTNQGLKGKTKQVHTRKMYRCLTVNALIHSSALVILW